MITAILSELLDNVTTVLLIVPITISIARSLEVNPMPILFAEIMASNIWGYCHFNWRPPNIMIGSATGLGFMEFVINIGPVVLVIMPVERYYQRVC